MTSFDLALRRHYVELLKLRLLRAEMAAKEAERVIMMARLK
jgi:hypothetical protein